MGASQELFCRDSLVPSNKPRTITSRRRDQPRTPHQAEDHREAALHRHQLFALDFTEFDFAHATLDRCNFIGSMDEFVANRREPRLTSGTRKLPRTAPAIRLDVDMDNRGLPRLARDRDGFRTNHCFDLVADLDSTLSHIGLGGRPKSEKRTADSLLTIWLPIGPFRDRRSRHWSFFHSSWFSLRFTGSSSQAIECAYRWKDAAREIETQYRFSLRHRYE
ncbi:hypothetical protein OKW50_008366 [Paraburkholderia youngii]